jgi:protein-tyrosine phosphatase
MTTRILYVCMGNICRSPTAEGVLRAMAGNRDLMIDSAGTGGWHVGNPPDPRAVAEAQERGIDISGLRARQVTADDFHNFDHILAMDDSNLAALERMRPEGSNADLRLTLSDAPRITERDVPDPYYDHGFPKAYALIEAAADGLLKRI